MILAGTFLAALAVATPVQVQEAWGQLGAPEPRGATLALLAELNSQAIAPFAAQMRSDAQVARLHGGTWDPGTQDPAEAARLFLAEYGALFGLPFGTVADLSVSVTLRGQSPTRAYAVLALEGIPLEGVELVVLLDAGQVVGAAGHGPRSFETLDAFTLPETRAAELATDSVRDARQRAVQPRWLAPTLERVFFATSERVHAAYRVEVSAETPGEAYSVYMDASTGTELAIIDRVVRIDGRFPYFGKWVKFDTTTAEGKVYRDQDDALAGIVTRQDLDNWSTGVPKPAKVPKGLLVGSRVFVWNDSGQNLFNKNGVYLFSPLTSPDKFDQVNTYYNIESFYGHLRNNLKVDLGSDFALPVAVNVKTPEVNAFFQSGPFPPTQHTDGYIVLNDMTGTLGPAADISRDPTVVHHEYTHAWIHFEKEDFKGLVDYPTRAVGEAIADFYSLAYHHDGAIGRYISLVALGLPFMRDLRDNDHFPETVLDALALGMPSGLPEEHTSGEVIGAMLLDLREEVGTKRVEKITFDALPFMPNSMGAVGYPIVSPGNAVEATGVYFATCVSALVTASDTFAEVGAALGVATGRGVLGDPASEQILFAKLENFPNRKAILPSRFVVATNQSFYFKANQGRMLRVKIVGDTSGTIQPDFVILGANGEPNPVNATLPKQFSGGNQIVEQLGIELLLPTGSLYQIEISTPGGTGGKHVLTLDA